MTDVYDYQRRLDNAAEVHEEIYVRCNSCGWVGPVDVTLAHKGCPECDSEDIVRED